MKIFNLTNKKIYLPVASSKVEAGFPSPAIGYEDERIDINDIIVSNPNSTFFVKVKGVSMIDANIFEDDILVVDKSLEATHGRIVIAVVNEDFTVKTLYKKDGIIKLIAANTDYPDIILNNEQELKVWGVVSYIIHKA